MKTLSEFIVERQAEYPNAKGELSGILSSIRLLAKIIHRDINKAGLTNILGQSGVENVQGESQMKLDLFAHNTMKAALMAREEVAGFASEEEESFIAFDTERGRNFLQPGNKQVAAGYIVYGSSTMLVYTTGNGVNGFTYDPSIGTFCLSHENMQMPKTGRIYSINEGQYLKFPQGVKKYIKYCQEEDKATHRPYASRYIGSLVADFHRNLLKGGIYIYPSATNYPNGKLRLLYEGNPIAFLAEQAGGVATDGYRRILDIEPTALHERVPLFVGSQDMVKKAQEMMEEFKE